MGLNELMRRHYAWLVDVGWAGKRTPLEEIALIASEVGEAANECRGAAPSPKLGEELADIVLRVLGFAEACGIDMERAVADKMAANAAKGTRGRLK